MTENFNRFLDLTVYQIYPKSFYDSNGDGIGDINGIAEKLEYIKELGANAIWICPIYQSPQCDNGYDISDYRALQPEYGTMEDFERLVQKAHGMGIKIIMDFVANHTSSEHKWFQEAKKSRDNPYHDYYYWAEQPLTPQWKSVFGGPAWEYNEATGEYYLHSFAVEQPDVNWTNPKVRKEFCDILDFWVDKGVDGFRCDVLDFISKDFEAGKMYNGPMIHDYLQELFNRDKVKHIFTVGECQANESSIRAICGEDRGELKCTFQFEHLRFGRKDKFTKFPHRIWDTASTLSKWEMFSQKHDFFYTLFTDNHDNGWFNSRIGNDEALRYESATMFATMFYALRGIPFLYQGQEIGAANASYSKLTDFDDVETFNFYKENKDRFTEEELIEKINFGGRDNARRPMAWNSREGFGFSTVKPWLGYNTRSGEINVESDLQREKSILRYYRKLLALRNQSRVLRRGDFLDLSPNEDCFVYLRTLGEERCLVVCNFEKEQQIDLSVTNGELMLSNYGCETATVNRIYKPYEAAIYRIRSI